MKKLPHFASICALPLFLLMGSTANAADLIPSQTFNTVDWTHSSGGFQVCSGGAGSLPCVNGTGQLTFAGMAAKTVTRSFTVAQSLHRVSFSVNGQGNFSADSGTVYLRAFNAGSQLLAETFVTTSFPNGSALPVNLVLQDATSLAAATRIEVTITASDSNGWGGNYGAIFFAPQLFTNDTDADGLEDAVDADADGDGVSNVSLQVSTGQGHACVIDNAGVQCWGFNSGGQINVPALVNPVAVNATYNHTCAIDSTGVHCWGQNDYGQTTVPTLVNPVAVSAGLMHTCAMDDTGVHCWGNNGQGQTTVPTLVNPVVVDAGYFHTCAMDDIGVHCWGYNNKGQTTVPTLVSPVAVSAGADHTCALDDTGVHCWGDNSLGQTTVPTLVNPVAVSAGALHTCAIDDNGVHCWGNNDDGQTTVPALTIPVVDNCPLVVNADQLNNEGDAQGDICDTDDDNDGVLDVEDVFPFDATESEDNDGDNIGDNADSDDNDASTLNDFLNEIKTDKAGSSVAFAGDFNNDGYGDYVIGIPGFDVSTKIKDAGRAVVISGKNGDELASVDGFVAKSAMGFAVAGNGDINNDGFDDVIVGSPNLDKNAGGVQILFGPDGVARYGIGGSYAGDLFGSAVAFGDVNNDGKSDIIIGAPKADDLRDSARKKVDAGSVLVFSGTDYSVLNTFYGDLAKAYFGTSVAAGDFDDDGIADIIVGAPNDDDLDHKLIDAGSVSVLTTVETQLLKQYGTVPKAYLGKSVASGDVNNDGYDDVLAGAPGDDTPAIHDTKKIVDTGSVIVFSGADSSELTKRYGVTAKAGLGNSVAAGDVNGDGNADIIAGASKDDMPAMPKIIKDTGSVSVFDGSSHTLITTLYGDVSKDAFGTAVSAGDVNSDGKADVIIGIPGKDIPPALPIKTIKDSGAVKVVSGVMFGS